VQPALVLKHFADFVSSHGHIYMVLITGLALRFSIHMLALLGGSWTVFWDAVIGRRATSLNFLTLFLS